MVVENLHFLDSLNYLPMSLKSMPKSFDLTCKKGYYPHFFNTADNLDYVGSNSEHKFYGADFMFRDERTQFSAWYMGVKDKIFNNWEELLAYCMDDVNVLKQACYAFRIFLKLDKIDPFRQAITISSICNKVIRTKFLKADSVGIIPRGGYRLGHRQSVEAFQWLAYIGRTRNISHAGNWREVRLAGVPNVKFDGYCEETNEVFEYLGFFCHGYLCMPNRHKPIGKTEETLEKRYEETKARLQKIENADNNKVVSIWGCEFRKLLSENPGLENELYSHPSVKNSPINIRDALYGGRTEATKTYYIAKEGEKIHYVDVISLYSYICKYGKFPLATRKCTWVQTVPLTVWIGRVLLNVRFCLL